MNSQAGHKELGGVISLSGVLLVLIGFGLLYAATKFAWISSVIVPVLGPVGRVAFIATCLCLTLWGVRIIITGYYAEPEARGIVRISRQRVMVPWQWVFYLLIMLVCFAGSLLGRTNMLMAVFAIMAGPFILNGWIAFSMLKRTDVRRVVPKRAMAGAPSAVEVVIANRKWLLSSWLMTVHDQIQGSEERLDAAALFARVPRRSTRSTYYQLRLMKRGKYTLGPLRATTRFPLGLVERGQLFDVYDEILVHPRLGKLSSTWKREQFMAQELVHREDRQRGVFDDEYHGIREYRWGDNPRAIHWRTSARHSELMVREYHQSRDQDLCLLLDLWQPARPSEYDMERVELAVSLTATICVEHMRSSGDSDLYVYADGAGVSSWEGPSRPKNVQPLLDALALVDGGPRPDVQRFVDRATQKRGPGTRTLMITTRQRTNGQIAGIDDQEFGRNVGETGSDIALIVANEHDLSRFFQLS